MNRTVTLSDGSVWEWRDLPPDLPPWNWYYLSERSAPNGSRPVQCPVPHRVSDNAPLTALDHRKIADVLDPPASAGRTDTERLDWLEREAMKGAGTVEFGFPESDDGFGIWLYGREKCEGNGTIREAIDAAMNDAARTPTPAEPSNG